MANKTKDPFAPFKDWLVDGPAGKWPELWEDELPLTPVQENIVGANAKLLLDKMAWQERIDAFEGALVKVFDKQARKNMRALYHIRFDHHEFVNFSAIRTRFPCFVVLRSVNFKKAAEFSECNFVDGVCFDETKFKGLSKFNRTFFNEGASFGGVEFFEPTNFDDTTFFLKSIFERVKFKMGVSFTKTKFGGSAYFNNAEFHGDSYFLETNFAKTANFESAEFGSGAIFRGAVFQDVISFDDVIFIGRAEFNGAEFHNDCYYNRVEFGGKTDFSYAKSSTYISFVNAKFSGDADFQKLNIIGSLHIQSKFIGEAIFSQLIVSETASFSGSSFSAVPDFRGSKFDRPPEVAGMMIPKPKLEKKKWWQFRRAVKPDDVVKLRKLKSMALDASDHEKDGEFFAKEMLAKRGWETKNFPGLLFNTIYWILSDFGQSFVRPVLWMVASIYSFFCAYLGVINWQLGTYALPPSSDERLVAFLLSVFNFLPLLGGLFRFAKTPKDHQSEFSLAYARLENVGLDVDLMVWLNVFQNIIGAVLLFLFLLALRNKFRLK